MTLSMETDPDWPWRMPDQLVEYMLCPTPEELDRFHQAVKARIPDMELKLMHSRAFAWFAAYHGLPKKIIEANTEIQQAKNRDDVAAAKERLHLFRAERERIIAGGQKIVAEGCRICEFAAFGFDQASPKRTVIIPEAWPHLLFDWNAGRATWNGRIFNDVRFCFFRQLKDPQIRWRIATSILEQRGHVPDELMPTPASDLAKKTATTPANPTVDDVPASDRTGAPGRPSSMHLILPELGRRIESGHLEPSLASQAASLLKWLVSNYPTLAPPTEKTIMNRIRESYKQARPREAKAC